ncbi:MAG: glycosyltransferase [Megasphaera sp.]|uniref:glycosyltransferase n=1 Tax=Megasphaera sp. TaxID=2023260 RepID=UPI003F06394C
MKILQFILPVGLGGVERIVSMLLNYGNVGNDEVYIAIGASYREQFCEKFKINDTFKVLPVNDKNLWNAYIDLKKIITTIKPDIIHTHARRECFLASWLSWSVKHVRTQHMAEAPKVRVSWVEKQLFHRNVDIWVATSQKLADTYLKKLKYIDKKKIRVIYNGIDVDMMQSVHDVRQYKFCIVSRLSKQKGIDILLKQIFEMPSEIQGRIRIDLWGEGKEKEKILKQINDLELNKIITYRGVTYTPTEILSHYDALLMPSRYEGLPLTMLESMAVGTPVAIHNVGCVSEFLNTGNNGWIIDLNYTWHKFFEDILNPEYDLKTISDNAKQTYKNKFVGKFMCDNYRMIYQKILEA